MNDIDRISPAKRPERIAVMHQRWAELGFLHWPVPVSAVRELIPRALTIDTFEGEAYVGLVPFTVTGARPMLVPPLPWVSRFHEINVRTYVHHKGADPGVWFFSLDASNPVVVAAARALFRLPYHHARIAMELDGTIGFRSQRKAGRPPAACRVDYTPLGKARAAAAGTLEHFLVERYILYTESGGRLLQAHVHHEPYPLQAAEATVNEDSLIAAAGIAPPEGDPPPLVHFAREVNVEIFALRNVGSA